MIAPMLNVEQKTISYSEPMSMNILTYAAAIRNGMGRTLFAYARLADSRPL